MSAELKVYKQDFQRCAGDTLRKVLATNPDEVVVFVTKDDEVNVFWSKSQNILTRLGILEYVKAKLLVRLIEED
ncbi:MAG: hypothetical protein K2Y51_25990 [Gammaproteobacteria bacterium]|nr:hypothetical protein [Gammaproteobacteria bacterium]